MTDQISVKIMVGRMGREWGGGKRMKYKFTNNQRKPHVGSTCKCFRYMTQKEERRRYGRALWSNKKKLFTFVQTLALHFNEPCTYMPYICKTFPNKSFSRLFECSRAVNDQNKTF